MKLGRHYAYQVKDFADAKGIELRCGHDDHDGEDAVDPHNHHHHHHHFYGDEEDESFQKLFEQTVNNRRQLALGTKSVEFALKLVLWQLALLLAVRTFVEFSVALFDCGTYCELQNTNSFKCEYECGV